MPAPNAVTVQNITDNYSPSMLSAAQAMMSTLRFRSSISVAPAYWSPARDNWLDEFTREPGNDLLSGASSTMVARIVSTPCYFEGPLALAMYYRNAFMNPSDLSLGYSPEISKAVQGFLHRDGGGSLELLRSSASDRTGPCLGFKHLDEQKTRPTGNPKYPLIYTRSDGREVRLHRSQVRQLVDLPSGREEMLGVGWCSVSRALSVASILMAITKYKQEKLSDLPPAGLLLLNNMSPKNWELLTEEYDTRQHNDGNEVWRSMLVAFGLDPAYPLTANMLEFSSLPEAYDDESATNIAIFSFALAFRVDPREFWPVSGGPLGTAREADIQHKKAKSKGEGIIFTELERLFNQPDVLPPAVSFRFDYRDTEEDQVAATIRGIKIQNIRRLWEKSLKAAPTPSTPGESDRGDPDDEEDQEQEERDEEETRQAPDIVPEDSFMGIITTEEARQLLVLEDIIPPEVLGQQPIMDRLYDVRWSPEVYGPRARVYRDGRVVLKNR